jgi:tRNA-2-methylthio-N6-dimethylallyladenosine synthase
MVGSALGERKRYSIAQLKKRLPQVSEFRPWWEWGFEKLGAFETRKDGKKAFVPIMKGCSHFCAYCVVPFSKGKEISHPFEKILCQVKELTEKGWQHFVFLGQNVNSYGKDFSQREKERIYSHYHDSNHGSEGGSLFALLLRVVHQIKGIKKISFITSNPWDLTDDIIKAMSLPRIDRYLHLPVQSGDDEILKRMNRPYTARQYFRLVEKIRKEIPNIKIGTDLIVGFPGETKKAFENTVRLCRQVGFVKSYIAMYSPRPGTAAFRLKNNVPRQEKRRRWRILNDLIN